MRERADQSPIKGEVWKDILGFEDSNQISNPDEKRSTNKKDDQTELEWGKDYIGENHVCNSGN